MATDKLAAKLRQEGELLARQPEFAGVDLHEHSYIFKAADALDALEAENKRLREALTLAANRLHRCSVDYPTGSIQFIECGEWAAEARAELDEARRARDLSRNRRETP